MRQYKRKELCHITILAMILQTTIRVLAHLLVKSKNCNGTILKPRQTNLP